MKMQAMRRNPQKRPAKDFRTAGTRLWSSVALSAIVLGRLVLQFFVYRDGFLAITADDFGRIIQDTMPWVSDPSSLHLYGVWLPFFKIIYGAGIRVYRDLLVTPRIISTIFGVLSILIIYRIAIQLFQKAGWGIIIAALFAFSPMGVWLASTSLSEMPYSLFVLACLFFYINYLGSRRSRYLIISCLFLGLTTGLRYEGWWLGVLMSIYIIFDQVKVWKHNKEYRIPFAIVVLSLILVWIFPICWMIGNYFQYHNPVWFIGDINNYKARWYGEGIDYLQYLRVIIRYDPLGFFLILAAFVLSLRQKNNPEMRFYLLISLLPVILFVILHGGRSEPSGNLLRYLASYVFCLFPLIGLLFVRLAAMRRVATPGTAVFTVFLILITLSGFLVEDFRYHNDPSAIGVAVGQEIKNYRKNESVVSDFPVMIELNHWDFLAIHTGANDVNWIMYDRPTGIPDRDAPSLFVSDIDQALACIDYYQIKLVVVKSEDIKDILIIKMNLTPDMTVNGYSFFRVNKSQIPVAGGLQCTLPMGVNQ